MIKNKYNVVGVMSGTSLDGVDYCWVEFSKNKHWSFKILAAETVSYSTAMITQLSAAISLNPNELNQLNQDYTKYLGHGVNAFIQKHTILNLDAVCSHGHTVLHQPEKGLTLQIGNLPTTQTLAPKEQNRATREATTQRQNESRCKGTEGGENKRASERASERGHARSSLLLRGCAVIMTQ